MASPSPSFRTISGIDSNRSRRHAMRMRIAPFVAAFSRIRIPKHTFAAQTKRETSGHAFGPSSKPYTKCAIGNRDLTALSRRKFGPSARLLAQAVASRILNVSERRLRLTRECDSLTRIFGSAARATVPRSLKALAFQHSSRPDRSYFARICTRAPAWTTIQALRTSFLYRAYKFILIRRFNV